MAALDFPASPTVGQKYPSPAVTGVPVYTWDGEKWTTVGGAIGSTGASDAIPQPDTGTGAAGSSTLWSRGDHAHPSDPTRAPIASPVFTGDPKAPTPTAGDNDTSVATTAFVTAAVVNSAGTIPTTYVRYDQPQSLTAPQFIQARQNIYAAPFDAMAYSGLQINGGMEVSQENGTSIINVTNTRKYIVDGWTMDTSGTQTMNCSQTTTSPDGITTSLLAGVNIANASPASSDFVRIMGRLEGYRVSRLMWGTAVATPMTLSFWARATRIGNYSVAIVNGASTRSYVTTFTVNATNTWEYKTVTIPGDTTGVWPRDNTLSMDICFTMMAGTGRVGAANTWTAGVILGVTGTINGVAAGTDGMWISGVTIFPGLEGPTAARSPFVMRPYDQELVTCQRYWERIDNGVIYGYQNASGYLQAYHPFKVMKRAVPTMGAVGWTATSNATNQAAVSATISSFWFSCSAVASGSAYFQGLTTTADARL